MNGSFRVLIEKRDWKYIALIFVIILGIILGNARFVHELIGKL
jgi:hypothetical protein